MFTLKIEQSFDSAHFLQGYVGKCANIHGHRWRVIAKIQSKKLIEDGEKRGMIIDFGDIKKDLKNLVDIYDHALVIEKDTMRDLTLKCLKEDGFKIIEVDFRATAEMFAFHFFNLIKDLGYNVKEVEVFETPTNSATYGV